MGACKKQATVVYKEVGCFCSLREIINKRVVYLKKNIFKKQFKIRGH